MSFPGIPSITYLPGYIIIGTHLSEPNSPFFNAIELEIELLTKWIDIWGFKNTEDRSTNHFNIRYELPDDVEFIINDNVKGCFTFAGSSTHNYEEEFLSTHKAKLKITSTENLTLHEILEFGWHFKKFLTLATQSNTYFKTIHLTSKHIVGSDGDEVFPQRLELLYRQRQLELKVENNNKLYFLFTFLDVAEQFQSLIKNWYNKKDILQPIIDTAYESYSKTPAFLETSFLNSIQALEIYHRRFRQKTYELIAEHSIIWEGIVNNLSEEQVKYISKFEYAYEPGLTKRLKDLIKEFDISTIRRLLGNTKQTKDFIFKTVASRNYYTHYDLKSKDNALKGATLLYTTEKLKALLLVTILFELGLNHQTIEKMLTKIEPYKYQFLLRNY